MTPALYIVSAFAFLMTFAVDKCMLLKFYRKPKTYDDSLARMVISLMPYAMFGHLVFSMAMFGADDVFYDSRCNHSHHPFLL